MRYGVVYKITNKIINKIYIGQTTRTIDLRLKWHLREDKHISHSLRKYGLKNFQIEEIVSATNQNDLNYLETYFINYYNSLFPNGYNHSCGGDNKGQISEIARKKMSLSHLGHTQNRGRKHSFEYAYNIAKRKPLKPILAINLDNPKQRIIFSFINEAQYYGFNENSIRQCLKKKRKHVNRWYFEYYDYANQSGSLETKESEHAPRLGSEPINLEHNDPTRFEIPKNFRGKVTTEELYQDYLKTKSCLKTAKKFNMKRITVLQRLKRNNLI